MSVQHDVSVGPAVDAEPAQKKKVVYGKKKPQHKPKAASELEAQPSGAASEAAETQAAAESSISAAQAQAEEAKAQAQRAEEEKKAQEAEVGTHKTDTDCTGQQNSLAC